MRITRFERARLDRLDVSMINVRFINRRRKFRKLKTQERAHATLNVDVRRCRIRVVNGIIVRRKYK